MQKETVSRGAMGLKKKAEQSSTIVNQAASAGIEVKIIAGF